MANKTEDIFVSVVLVASENIKITQETILDISKTLSSNYSNYEIICITTDSGLFFSEKTKGLLSNTPCVRIVQLSKRENTDVLIFAGIESAIGDVVVVLLAGKDPVNMIPGFVELNKQNDIVFGISEKRFRTGFINEYGSKLFYWYNKKFLKISIPNRSTYFISFNRRSINALTTTGRYAKHIRHMSRLIGYKTTDLNYKTIGEYSEHKSIKQLVVSAVELATNYSKHPLRFVSWLGFFIAVLNVLYAFYVVTIKIFKQEVAEGWTTTSLQLSIMFFFLFLILAIFAEYIGKILEESRGESPYNVVEEYNSKVSIADVTRRNITK